LRWDIGPAVRSKLENSIKRPDLAVTVRSENKEFLLFIEVKPSGEPLRIKEAAGTLMQLRELGYPVLVAPFISERGRDLCKALDMGCVDLAGNAYLRFDGIWVERWGKDNPTKEKRILKSLFTLKATFVLRTMFADLKKEWTTERLSKAAGVSLGQVSKVVNRLAFEDYIDKQRGRLSLKNPGGVLDAWTKVYDYGNNRSTGYFCDDRDREAIFNRLLKLGSKDYALTLGAAASLVAPVVRSTDVQIYTKADRKRIIKALDLKPVEFGGNVHLVDPPDEGVLLYMQKKDGLTIVSDLQLYLDLYNYPMRGREQAEAVRQRILGR